MAKVIEFPVVTDSGGYWGVCPKCYGSDGNLDIGPDHWFHCRKHKLKWSIGSNLFSAWVTEDESIWAANAQFLAGYKQVNPHFPYIAPSADYTEDDVPFLGESITEDDVPFLGESIT